MIISTKVPDYLYRKGVGMVVVNKDKRIFVGKRVRNKSNVWQMPQGGVDIGETEEGAVMRELREETGIAQVKLIQKSKDYYYYHFPANLRKKFWNGKFLGQKQRWFLLQFSGDIREDVSLKGGQPEFSRFRWVTPEFLVENVVNFKQDMYKEIMKEFTDHLR